MNVRRKEHLTAVRKSTRTIKKTQRVLESADSSLDDVPENPSKKPRTSTKPRHRKIDYCKNGEPFKCSICESPYINTSSGKSKCKLQKYPIERERNGVVLQLCVKCSSALTNLENKGPSSEEREEFEEEGRQFAEYWSKLLKEPDASRLYCSLYQSSKCGCIQNYVNGTITSSRKRKTSQTYSDSSQCELSDAVSGNDNLPAEQSDPTVKVMFLIGLLKESKLKRKELKLKRKQSGEELATLNKSLDSFILSNRVRLKYLGICERGCQKVLCYSNNFLHKKPASSEARLQRTKGNFRVGNVLDLKDLHKQKCCEKNCCKVASVNINQLKEWRNQAQVSQKDMWRVIAEMFGFRAYIFNLRTLTSLPSVRPAETKRFDIPDLDYTNICCGSKTACCPKFIRMVTGCCNSTVHKVYYNFLLSKGDVSRPEHGMKFHWEKQKKENKLNVEAVSQNSQTIVVSDKQGESLVVTSNKDALVDKTYEQSTSSAKISMATLNNQLSAAVSLPAVQQCSERSHPASSSADDKSDIEQKIKKEIPQLCINLDNPQSNRKLLELVSGLIEIQKHKEAHQISQTVSSPETWPATTSVATTASGHPQISSKIPQPVFSESLPTTAQRSFLGKMETVTLVSSQFSQLTPTDPVTSSSVNVRHVQTSVTSSSNTSVDTGVPAANLKNAVHVQKNLNYQQVSSDTSPLVSLTPGIQMEAIPSTFIPDQFPTYNISSSNLNSKISLPIHLPSVQQASTSSTAACKSPLTAQLPVTASQTQLNLQTLPSTLNHSQSTTDLNLNPKPDNTLSSRSAQLFQKTPVQISLNPSSNSVSRPYQLVITSATDTSTVLTDISLFSEAQRKQVGKFQSTSSTPISSSVPDTLSSKAASSSLASSCEDRSLRHSTLVHSLSDVNIGQSHTRRAIHFSKNSVDSEHHSLSQLSVVSGSDSLVHNPQIQQMIESQVSTSLLQSPLPFLNKQPQSSSVTFSPQGTATSSIKTPSSCSSGSFVFDALADSPIRDVSLQVSPQTSAKSSLLCEMLLSSHSLPLSGINSSDHHATHQSDVVSCSSDRHSSHQSVIVSSESLYSFGTKTCSISNSNLHLEGVESCPQSSNNILTVEHNLDTCNTQMINPIEGSSHQPTLKVNRVQRTRDPPQVGIVNPYISSSLKPESSSNQSRLLSGHLSSSNLSTFVRANTSQDTDIRRLDQFVSLSSPIEQSLVQHIISSEPIYTGQSTIQTNHDYLQTAIEDLNPATTVTLVNQYDNSSTCVTNSDKSDVLPTQSRQCLPSGQNNLVGSSVQGSSFLSHLVSTVPSSSNCLTQTVSSVVSSASPSAPIILQAILCQDTGQVKLVPLLLTREQSPNTPVVTSDIHSTNQIVLPHPNPGTNSSVATTGQTILPSSQTFTVLPQKNDLQHLTSTFALGHNSNLQLVLNSGLLKNSSLPQMQTSLGSSSIGQTIFLSGHSNNQNLFTHQVTDIGSSDVIISPGLDQQAIQNAGQSSGHTLNMVKLDSLSDSFISGSHNILPTAHNSSFISSLSQQLTNTVDTNVPGNPGSHQRPLRPKPESSVQQMDRPESSVPQMVRPESSVPQMVRPESSVQEMVRPESIVQHVIRPEPSVQQIVRAESSVQQMVRAESSVQQMVRADPSVQQMVRPKSSKQQLVRSESGAPNASKPLLGQNCTFLLVPDQPNFPTYQIALCPNIDLESQIGISVQDTVAVQQSGERATSLLPSHMEDVQSDLNSCITQWSKPMLPTDTISQPSVVVSVQSLSNTSVPTSAVYVGATPSQPDLSQLGLLLKQPAMAFTSESQQNPCITSASHISVDVQPKSYLSITPEVKPNYLSAVSSSLHMAHYVPQPNKYSKALSVPDINQPPNGLLSFKTNVVPSTPNQVSALLNTPPNLINKPGEITFLRNKEVIDLTEDSPPLTPASKFDSTNSSKGDSHHLEPTQVSEKLVNPVLQTDQSQMNQILLNCTEKPSNDTTLHQILNFRQSAKNSQEMPSVQILVIAQPGSTPLTFSTSRLATQELSDTSSSEVCLSLPSQVKQRSQGAQDHIHLAPANIIGHKAGRNLVSHASDHLSLQTGQRSAPPVSSVPVDLKTPSHGTTLSNQVSHSEMEWVNQLAVTSSSSSNKLFLVPSSSPQSSSYSTCKPVSPLSSYVVFTRATNTPMDAVGPPNITVMSPSRITARLRSEPCYLPASAVVNVATPPLITNTLISVSKQPVTQKTMSHVSPPVNNSTISYVSTPSLTTSIMTYVTTPTLTTSTLSSLKMPSVTPILSTQNSAQQAFHPTLIKSLPGPNTSSQSTDRTSSLSVTPVVKVCEGYTIPQTLNNTRALKPRKKPSTVLELLKSKETSLQNTSLQASSTSVSTIPLVQPVGHMTSSVILQGNLVNQSASVQPTTLTVQLKNVALGSANLSNENNLSLKGTSNVVVLHADKPQLRDIDSKEGGSQQDLVHTASIPSSRLHMVTQSSVQQQVSIGHSTSPGTSDLPKLVSLPALPISGSQKAISKNPVLIAEPKLKFITQPLVSSPLTFLPKSTAPGLTIVNCKPGTGSAPKHVTEVKTNTDEHLMLNQMDAKQTDLSSAVLQFVKSKQITSTSFSASANSPISTSLKLKLPSQQFNSQNRPLSESREQKHLMSSISVGHLDESLISRSVTSECIRRQNSQIPEQMQIQKLVLPPGQPILTSANPILSNILFSPSVSEPSTAYHSTSVPKNSISSADELNNSEMVDHRDLIQVNLSHPQTNSQIDPTVRPFRTIVSTSAPPAMTQDEAPRYSFDQPSKYFTQTVSTNSEQLLDNLQLHKSETVITKHLSGGQFIVKSDNDHIKTGRIGKIIDDMYNRGDDVDETTVVFSSQPLMRNPQISSINTAIQVTNKQTTVTQNTALISRPECLEMSQNTSGKTNDKQLTDSRHSSQTWKSPKKIKNRKVTQRISKKTVKFLDQIGKSSTKEYSSPSQSSHSLQNENPPSPDLAGHPMPSREVFVRAIHQHHTGSKLKALLSSDARDFEHRESSGVSATTPLSSTTHQLLPEYEEKLSQPRHLMIQRRSSGNNSHAAGSRTIQSCTEFPNHSGLSNVVITAEDQQIGEISSTMLQHNECFLLSKPNEYDASSQSGSNRVRQGPDKVYPVIQNSLQTFNQPYSEGIESLQSSFDILSHKGYSKLSNTRKSPIANETISVEENLIKKDKFSENCLTCSPPIDSWLRRTESGHINPEIHSTLQVTSSPSHLNLASSYKLAQQMSHGASFSKENLDFKESESSHTLGRTDYSPQVKTDKSEYNLKKTDHFSKKETSLPNELFGLHSPIFSEHYVNANLMEPIVAESSSFLESLSTLKKDICEKKQENRQLKKKIARIQQKQKSGSDHNSSSVELYNDKKFIALDIEYQTDGEPVKKLYSSGSVASKVLPELARQLGQRNRETGQSYQEYTHIDPDAIFLEETYGSGPVLTSRSSGPLSDRQESPELCVKGKDPLVSSSSLGRPPSQLELEFMQHEHHIRQRYPSSEFKSTLFRSEPDSIMALLERHRNPSSSQRSSDLDFYEITQRHRNPSTSSLKSGHTDFELLSLELGTRSRHASINSYLIEPFAVRSRNPSGSSNRRSRPGSSSSDREFPGMDDLSFFPDIARTRSRNSSGESLEPTVEPIDHNTMQLYGPQSKH